MRGTFFLEGAGWNSNNTAALRTMVSAGTMEVASHTWSHTNLTYDHALNFSQTGGANCTVAFDGATITCDCDGTDYDQTCDTTATATDTLGEIITALHSKKGWTVAKSTTGGQAANNIYDNAKATSFTNLLATAEPCDIDFDRTGYTTGLFKDEIADAKTWMAGTLVNGAGNVTDGQTGATYVCNSLAAPYNAFDAESEAAAKASGYLISRGTLDTETATGTYYGLQYG